MYNTYKNLQSIFYKQQSSVYNLPSTIYHHAIYHLQYTIYNIPSAIYHLQYTIYNLTSTISHLQSTIYNLPSKVYSIHSSVFQSAVNNLPTTPKDLQFIILQSVIYNLPSSIYTVWSIIYFFLSTTCDLLYTVLAWEPSFPMKLSSFTVKKPSLTFFKFFNQAKNILMVLPNFQLKIWRNRSRVSWVMIGDTIDTNRHIPKQRLLQSINFPTPTRLKIHIFVYK